MEQELKSWWTRKILSFQWWGSTSSSKAPTPFPLGVHLFYTVLAPTPFYRQILAPHLNDTKKVQKWHSGREWPYMVNYNSYRGS